MMDGVTVRLSDLCDVVSEAVKPGEQPDSLYLGLEHLASGRLVRVAGARASDMRSNTSAFQPSDVLYGKLRPYLDKAILADEAGVCTTELLVLRAKADVEPRFLAAIVHSPLFVEFAVAGTTGVQHPRTSWFHVREFEAPAFSLTEQRQIAGLLWLVHQAISASETLANGGQELKRTAMQTLFTRGLRGEAQKETEIGPVPESWEVGQLGKFADIISTRMAYTELEKADPTDSEDAVKVQGIKVADMNLLGNETELEAAILERMVDKCHAEYLCAPPGTIIFPKRGAAIATNKKRISTQWTAFDPNVIGVAPREGIERRFLFQWFQMFDLRTITDLGPTPQLNKKNLLPVIVPVPPTDEQHEIAAILDAIDRKIDLHRRKRAVLEELFQSLLHKLMTGEIRVGELNLPILSRRFPNLLEPPRR